ncbi:BrnA antitoxin family protein [Methyloversatilis sp.]|uniref:BrnA antitoxin family protein n=1 Tax=Methyloversatilis sp. TaxID=2569862 RepID=UPI003F706CE3
MTASKRASGPSLGSDLKRVDGHVIQPAEYDELPELDDEMLARGKVNRGGRPRSANPKRLISIRLTEDVIQRWRATGPGWQTRMAESLSRLAPTGSGGQTGE